MTRTQIISLDQLSDLKLNKQDRTLTLEFIANPISQESSVRKVGHSIIVTRNGKERLLVDAVRDEFNIPKSVSTTEAPLRSPFQAIRVRIANGMSFEEAIADYQNKPLTLAHQLRNYLGVDQAISKANPPLKAAYEGVKNRIQRGMSFDEAIDDYSKKKGNRATLEKAKALKPKA